MSGEIAFPISIYAAVEADAAREAAELAERRAFMAGYSHANATPEERQRYVESVRVLYPQADATKQQTDTRVTKTVGGAIVFAFGLCISCGVWRWFKDGDFADGVAMGGAIFLVMLLATCFIGLFILGVAMMIA